MVLLPLLRCRERHWKSKTDNEAIERAGGLAEFEHTGNSLTWARRCALNEDMLNGRASDQMAKAV